MNDLLAIQNDLQRRLSGKRYEHTIGVAHTAACLAMRYGIDIDRAWMAGLLHDCAKYMLGEELLAECLSLHIPVTETEHQAPHLLHAKLGSWYAKERYGVIDEEILSSIQLHTTGKPAMTMLEQILFIADYIEPGRKVIPGLAEIRAEAFQDINLATLHILENTLSYLKGLNTIIDEQTILTLSYYQKITSPEQKEEQKGACL